MSHRYLPLLLLVACWPAHAEIFKCVAPNGELTFSQTPCPEEGSKVTVERTVKSSTTDEAECQYAHRFALSTAREMKSGVASSTLFDRYGGLNAMSRGSVSLISYVYQYRTNDDVSAERVASLSVAKCKAKSFGDVGCEQLPDAYTSQFGGCEQVEENGGAAAIPVASTAASQPNYFQTPQQARATEQAQYRDTKTREKEQRAACKERIRDQIDRINSQLRAGYSASQGTRLRDRRRDLEEQMRDC